ncbi:MAG: c-type cytochrome [Verrucomicrobiales bacterium]|nr:cytochrome c [Verrucomicrobiota bacterium JB025]
MSENDPQTAPVDSVDASVDQGAVAREAAACAREKPLVGCGNEPISIWVIAACGFVVLIAGAILGSGGRLFSYGELIRANYARATAPGADKSGPEPKAALDAYMARGAKIYSAKCNGCHGPDAKGDGANYPSLVGSAWSTGETERFAMIILNGLTGPTSTGKAYGAGMVSQAAGLTAEDLAGVMTYVRNNFGNEVGDVITTEMAQAAMDTSAARDNAGMQMTKEELDANHVKPLPGEPLDPAALVDPITLVKVAGAAPAAAAPAAPES